MRLRIVGDGTFRGTRIETETGEQIQGVQRVTWECGADQQLAKIEMTVIRMTVDVKGEFSE